MLTAEELYDAMIEASYPIEERWEVKQVVRQYLDWLNGGGYDERDGSDRNYPGHLA